MTGKKENAQKYITDLKVNPSKPSAAMHAANAEALEREQARRDAEFKRLRQDITEKAEKVRSFFTGDNPAVKKQLPGAAAWYEGKKGSLKIEDVLDLAILVDRIQAIIDTAPAGSIDFFNAHTKKKTADFLDGIFYRARQRRDEQIILWEDDPGLPAATRIRSDSGDMLVLFDFLTNALIGRINKEAGELETPVNAGSFPVKATGKNKVIEPDLFATSITPDYIENPFSVNDWVNYCAICQIYVDGHQQFTPEQVYKKKNALPPSANVPPEARKDIVSSIERIRGLLIDCNVLAYYKLKGLCDADDTLDNINEQALIVSCKRTRNAKSDAMRTPENPDAGIKITYTFQAAPVLYVHAKRIKQLWTHDKKLHDVRIIKGDGTPGKRINSNKQREALRFWLLLNVINRKYGNYDSNNIIYDNLFATCGIDFKNRKLRLKARTYILDVLAYWKWYGFINGFKEYPETGQKITGIILDIERKQKADKNADPGKAIKKETNTK